MNHPATTPRQTSRCLFGIGIGNHNETLITARPARSGLEANHNETLITRRPPRRSGINLGNHNETLIAARPAGSALNQNETLIADGRAWPHPEYCIPVTAAPVR